MPINRPMSPSRQCHIWHHRKYWLSSVLASGNVSNSDQAIAPRECAITILIGYAASPSSRPTASRAHAWSTIASAGGRHARNSNKPHHIIAPTTLTGAADERDGAGDDAIMPRIWLAETMMTIEWQAFCIKPLPAVAMLVNTFEKVFGQKAGRVVDCPSCRISNMSIRAPSPRIPYQHDGLLKHFHRVMYSIIWHDGKYRDF